MKKMVFESSPRPTLGIELEFALVDAETMALSSSIQEVLEALPDGYARRIKPELMQSYVEVNTKICENTLDAEADLRETIGTLEQITDNLGLRLLWTGTHPFSIWQDQVPTRNERYARLLEILQDMGRRLVTFGLHVHVGVDSGDKAVMVCERILRHLPTLLALSCNSPWWNNRVTGLRSHRTKVMEGLPTAGLPVAMRNWSEYVWLMNHLIETGFINSIRDIWWDVRPHHNFGTVEVRVCDMPGCLEDVLAIVALVHCLVQALSEDIDRGAYQLDCHPMMARQNKWRAARYGLGAQLVDSFTLKSTSAREAVFELADKLQDTAEQLDCVRYLDRAREMARRLTWAERQLELLKKTGDPREVARRMIEMSRISAPDSEVATGAPGLSRGTRA